MTVTDDFVPRRPGYVPTFLPQPGGPGDALLRIAANQLDELHRRLAQATDKRGFALLDLVGVSLVPATAARAPVVFQPSPGLDHVTAPAGTRLGATVPGRGSPLVFETERTVAIASARLVEVASVVPGLDAFTSHAGDLGAGTTVTLFDAATQFSHDLYLAHSVVLGLAGRSIVELLISMRMPASSPLTLQATWWDGKTWRPFAPFADPAGDEDSSDGTVGLTRGGTIRLFVPCADGKTTSIRGAESNWIRLSATTPLGSPRPAGSTLPVIERLRMRTVVERRLVAQRIGASTSSTVHLWSADGHVLGGKALKYRSVTSPASVSNLTTDATGASNMPFVAGETYQLAVGTSPTDADWLPSFTASGSPARVDLVMQHGLLPDKAMSDGRVLDATKSFAPLGPNPEPGAALYLACEEIASRPGATVALDLSRPKTAQEEADEHGSIYELEINAALALIHSIENSLTGIADALDELRIAKDINGLEVASGPIGSPLPVLTTEPTGAWYGRLKTSITTLIGLIGTAVTTQINELVQLGQDIADAIVHALDPTYGPRLVQAAEIRAANATVSIAKALELLGVTVVDLSRLRGDLEDALKVHPPKMDDVNPKRDALQLQIKLIIGIPQLFIAGQFPPFLTMPAENFVALVEGRLAQATTAILSAANSIRAIVNQLLAFDPAILLAAHGVLPPLLTPAVVAWEYWDGGRWAPLPGLGAPLAGVSATNLQASGVVRFTVPESWETVDVAGDKRRWMRARLASGHYSRLRLVAWTDAKSNLVNFLPVIEPRPPVLDRVEITYRSVSDLVEPQHATSFDDAEWRDHTSSLPWPGPGFQPFRACRDRAPTLYLGFEAPLPAETLGLFFEIEERIGARPLALRFQAWDGAGFQEITVDDGTRGLTTSGVTHLVWPGDAAGIPSLVVRAGDNVVTLGEPGAGLRFAPGTVLWLADSRGGELVEVASRTDDELVLARPLSRAYAGAMIRSAPPARFGQPLTWLRILLDADAEPPPIGVRRVVPNAVWASNVETFTGEVAGGSDGTPGQIVFLRRSPVLPGEVVEIRELEGPRAAIDAPILADELARTGRSGDLRLEHNPTTGKVAAAWVRWRSRDSLAFSDGEARDYVIDRSGGRLIFGTGRFGRIAPAGANNISVTYRAGGDVAANVAAGAISTVLSGVLARGVSNPLPAQGASAGEAMPA